MKLKIPDRFQKMLNMLTVGRYFTNVIKVLEWVDANPKQAEHVAEAVMKLDNLGRDVFEKSLFYSKTPQDALEHAIKISTEESEKRSKLSKFIHSTRKGGYNFKLNGCPCVVTCDQKTGKYIFKFTPGNTPVYLIFRPKYISYVIQDMEKGTIWTFGLSQILYKGTNYSPRSRTGQLLIDAIQRNIRPEVMAVINAKEER